MFGIGSGEILVLAIIVLVLFGKEDLPATLRKFSKGWNEFRRVANDAQRSWSEVRDDVTRTIMEADNEINAVIQETMHVDEPKLVENSQKPDVPLVDSDQPAPSTSFPSILPAAGTVAVGALVEPSQAEPIVTSNAADTNAATHIQEANSGDQHHNHHQKRADESETTATNIESGTQKS